MNTTMNQNDGNNADAAQKIDAIISFVDSVIHYLSIVGCHGESAMSIDS